MTQEQIELIREVRLYYWTPVAILGFLVLIGCLFYLLLTRIIFPIYFWLPPNPKKIYKRCLKRGIVSKLDVETLRDYIIDTNTPRDIQMNCLRMIQEKGEKICKENEKST